MRMTVEITATSKRRYDSPRYSFTALALTDEFWAEGKEMKNRLHYSNDDKSPLIDLLNCIVCGQAMKIEKSSPDADGMDIIQYRCGRCERIERVRLLRRSRDALDVKAKGK
jgi:hypothetical protein